MMDKRILPDETEIVGAWRVEQGRQKADDVARRIDELIEGYFQDVAVSQDGWSRLYRDRNDGRYWELTYPDSDSHGGGAPRLTNISGDEATARYKL